MSPYVEFRLAKEEDIIRFILELSYTLERERLKDRNYEPCIYVPIPKEIRNEILTTKNLKEDSKNKLKRIIKRLIDMDRNEMKIFLDQIEKYWINNCESFYFEEIKKIIGKKFQNHLIVYITNAITGAYFKDNKITLTYYKKMKRKELMSYASSTIGEEILHLIYWDIWKEVFNKNLEFEDILRIEGKRWSTWHISEIIPDYILIQNKNFRRFGWNKIDRTKTYKWIGDFKKIADPLWEKRRNLKDFILSIHKTCGCLP